MTFKATRLCPILPDHLSRSTTPKPVPEVDDDTIDTFLQAMIDLGAPRDLVPLTKYGRRTAVAAFLRYNAIQPVGFGHQPWTPANPTQPR